MTLLVPGRRINLAGPYREESMYEVGLDRGQSLILDQNGVGFIPLGAHEGTKPGLLGEFW